jgi:hypothetical protein
MTALDLDITRTSRPWTDYDLDVMVGGEWVASAKNNHAADDTAHEVWYRSVLDQPAVAQGDETPPNDAPGDDCPDHGPYGDDDCPKCADPDCQGLHHTQQCPAIRELLFAPFTDVCRSCGDQLDWEGPGICGTCREWAEPIAA